MQTDSSLTPSCKIIQFPVQHACPKCQQPCGEDELSQCLRCGAKYCGNPKCWQCDCDLFAEEIAYRLTGKPIEEPADENVLALAFIQQQFGRCL